MKLSFSLKKIVVSVCLMSAVISSTSAFAYNTTTVWDQIGSQNVRSGPGTNYSIIAQVSDGEDLVDYCPTAPNGCSSVTDSTNTYSWNKVYYPNSSYGQYHNSAVGHVAYYKTSDYWTRYQAYTDGAYTTSSVQIYSDAEWTDQIGGTSSGIFLQGDGVSATLKAWSGNPNSWKVSFSNGYNWAKSGWYMNARRK